MARSKSGKSRRRTVIRQRQKRHHKRQNSRIAEATKSSST